VILKANRFSWLLVVLALGASASASDWPHWRGPSATGIAAPSPLPSSWSASQNVAWQVALEGAGVSSPIVSGNRVFVTSQGAAPVIIRRSRRAAIPRPRAS
jgi:outer membrane protein assembly factor BamB